MLGRRSAERRRASETARRTIRDGSRAADVITALARASSARRNPCTEPVDLNEATAGSDRTVRSELNRNRALVRTELG